jgi:hypothetical protein
MMVSHGSIKTTRKTTNQGGGARICESDGTAGKEEKLWQPTYQADKQWRPPNKM